ncbi:MAG: hypothetical protein KKA22_12925 [Gammaproteobacteria bacterium]|nr:hypothetical protein [Gammaproteobacteria bacterium]MBU1409039.1 hypothetical protein [Gammaproteobacteria bacterium]MBU1533540.1 hypothetical protein [Gammaproteobacteria bacterium]
MKLADRIARLESRYRSAAPDPFTDGVLDRLTDAELHELSDLFRHNGAEEFKDLPADVHARAMELLSTARQRSDPAPWPASSAPGYDAMASIRELYEASQARLLGAAHHCHPGEMVRAENWEIIKPRHKT